jgi:hypothetical protein
MLSSNELIVKMFLPSEWRLIGTGLFGGIVLRYGASLPITAEIPTINNGRYHPSNYKFAINLFLLVPFSFHSNTCRTDHMIRRISVVPSPRLTCTHTFMPGSETNTTIVDLRAVSYEAAPGRSGVLVSVLCCTFSHTATRAAPIT